MQSYLRNLVKENNINLDESYINNLEEKYRDYLYTSQDILEKDFSEQNDFQTTIRGLKVRGVYDTQREAEVRAKVLQRKDKNFNVFVGQVGYWLPWDPTPHKIDNQEYFEKELNELVKKYNENQDQKEDHFRENIDYVKEQAAKKVEQEKLERENSKTLEKSVVENTLKTSLEKLDPWLASKSNNNINTSEIETL